MNIRLLAGGLLLASTLTIFAATHLPPARLAVVVESPGAASIGDLLTVELSQQPQLQLLERNEIEKVYREQGLAAGGKGYLKLGQVLGADGLLLVDAAKDGTNQFVNFRLVAVKPGVVLIAQKIPLATARQTGWVAGFWRHLSGLFPKLTVLTKDALPISVVNLRCAVSYPGAIEIEGQLKLLAIQRLSEERQFFVLERQQMQMLGEEKELKADDSDFWNGSYLLEGVVDQNGHSQSTITIDARLTPPRGGAPLRFSVSGSRANLAEVINRLAAKVNELLQVDSAVTEWRSADEAEQYFAEAQWALKWEVLAQARSAADSAWALGKKDMDCAALRVRCYLGELPPELGSREETVVNRENNLKARGATYESTEASRSPRWFGLLAAPPDTNATIVTYLRIGRYPEIRKVELALRALEIYRDFGRTLPAGEPQIGCAVPSWRRGFDAFSADLAAFLSGPGIPEGSGGQTRRFAGRSTFSC